MSIIGIDDHRMSWFFMGLTTIAQPVAGQGAFAANLLLDRLHHPGLPNPRPATAGDRTGRMQEHPPPAPMPATQLRRPLSLESSPPPVCLHAEFAPTSAKV
ncbi:MULTISPECIES: hypothetical protein [unclassified Arthrobacter]|uniref:hypothetical protein n=1 Tax=unclassified Arthrobacter TaxID=235627 RepID=UPI0027D8EFCC|nr:MULTISPECIES: hypothetical protein [unclassified Arthrobacter]